MGIAKKVATTVLAAGAILGSGAITASPAYAATGFDRCPHGSFCIFSGFQGQGTIAIYKWGSPDIRQQGFPNRRHNTVGSYWNRSPNLVHAYYGYNYTDQVMMDLPAYGVPIPYTANGAGDVSSIRAV